MDGPQTLNRKQRRKAKQGKPVAVTPAQQFDVDVATGRAKSHQLQARRYKATKHCCSSTWAEHHWHGELHTNERRAWHTAVEYPPGGKASKMAKCLACGRFTPPQCIVRHKGTQLCQDCAMAGFQPIEMSSHTVISESRMKWCHRKGKSYDGII